jgi:hypothetical protein
MSSDNIVISTMITVDTDKVLQLYPDPSTNEKSPTTLHLGENCAFMVVSGATEVTGQGTWSLSFKANVGDILRGFAVSCSNNFDDAVVLYGFTSITSLPKPVTSPFAYKDFTRSEVVGGSVTPLPAKINEGTTFTLFEGDVINPGKATFNVNFALYGRVKGKLTLKGYYSWDPTIEVLG